MTQHQKDQLLDALMHYVTPEIRRKVSAELPEAYEAYHRVQRAVNQMTLDEHDRVKAL